MSTDKCPHCGAERRDLCPRRVSWTCNSYSYDRNTVYRSQLCEERADRQKAEKELAETRRELELERAVITNHSPSVVERQLEIAMADLKKAEKERNELATELVAWKSEFRTSQLSHASDRLRVAEMERDEARRKLEEAADLIAKLKPYLRHSHPRCVTLCECGLNKVIMDAGRQADVVKADAAAKKGGAS